jgi:hypothetical protein
MKNGLLVLAVASAAFVACSKAPEKAAEKAIESAMSKDGTKAKVDLSSAGTRITTTDASGKTSQMEIGGAKVAESDVGVPFYPGAKVSEGGSSKVSTPDGQMYTVMLQTPDATDKVAAFYREKLKGMSEGKQMMDMSGADGAANLMLADEKTKAMIQVHVMKGEKGTDLQIVANRPAAK